MNPSPAVPVARALAGASLVVTRPAADATAFVRRARSLGARALRLPGTALRARGALAMPDPPCEAWIFTSPAAVRHAFTSARLVPDARVAAFAVGEGTRRALARHGIAAAAPQRADSEGLLALPGLASVRGQRIALVGAPGGRGLIDAQLRRRGAEVVALHVYERVPPRWSTRQLEALCSAPAPLLTLVSSGEALANLAGRLPADVFERLRIGWLVTSSERLAGLARGAGFEAIEVAASASAGDLFAAAQRAWNRARAPAAAAGDTPFR